MVQLLSMVLDFLDALAGAVTIACWWCTWVRPRKQVPRPNPSGRAEIDRFLCNARIASRPVPLTSSQPIETSEVTPPA